LSLAAAAEGLEPRPQPPVLVAEEVLAVFFQAQLH